MVAVEGMTLQRFAAWTDLHTLMKDYTLIALQGDEVNEYAEKGKYADDFVLDEYGMWFQRRYMEDISKEELAYAADAAKSDRTLCNVISHLASAFKEFKPSDDDV